MQRLRSGGLLLLPLVLLQGCASAPPAETRPPLDAGQLAQSAENASALDEPYRLVFEWSLTEPGLRLRGQGVARVEPPYRARLDLFAPNGERVAAAALVGGDLRIPAGLPGILPPPALFWGTLGVFRPGTDVALRGGQWARSGVAELHYGSGPDNELRYQLTGSDITAMDFRSGGQAREEVRLVRGPGERFPRQAIYRHLGAVRELQLTLQSVEHVESFPQEIWNPAD